jgi:uncharacterized Zn-binding protein involved in type VI secretion
MASAQQAARITDPVTHGLGMLGIIGGMLIGAVVAAILIVSLPVTAPALVVGITAAAAVGAVAGGGLAGHQLLQGIQRACSLPSPATGIIGVSGSPNVRVGNLLAARVVADMAVPCNGLFGVNHLPIPPLPPAPIAEGAETIRINNFLAARVTSKVVCGASIKQGSLTVYYGGPTKRLLAVFDLEEMMMSVLGFLAKASLIAIAIMTIPLGIGAMATFAAIFGGFMAVNYGLGVLGDKIGPGWKDMLQGGFGLAAIVGGAKLGSKASDTPQELPAGPPTLPEFDGQTSGVLVPENPPGPPVELQSGPRTGARFPYSQADGHVETQGALWMKENGVTQATLYHNNPKGTCGNCDYYLPTFLDQNSTMTVVPPENAVAPTPRWVDVPKTYTGNSNSPY